jgi:hypothetical protein
MLVISFSVLVLRCLAAAQSVQVPGLEASCSTSLLQVRGDVLIASSDHAVPSKRLEDLRHVNAPLHLNAQKSTAEPLGFCSMKNNICRDWPLERLSFEEGSKLEAEGIRVDTSSKLVHDALQAGAVQIVVTRINEDLRWLDAFAIIPTIVYNRGATDAWLPTPRANLKIIQEPNVGREDQVMLQHIVDHYDDLANFTFFLQGWPFNVCQSLIRSIASALITVFDPAKVEELSRTGFRPFGNYSKGLIPLSSSYWAYQVDDGLLGLAISIIEDHQYPGQKTSPMKAASDLYKLMCTEILDGAPCPKYQWAAEGAQWGVTKSRIHLQPLKLYQNALNLGEGFEGKFRGLVLEGMWAILWNGGKLWDPFQEPEVVQGHYNFTALMHANAMQHCRVPEAIPGLLWSCQEKMSICEIQWQQDLLAASLNDSFAKPDSSRFLLERMDFQISDASIFSSWSMTATLSPNLKGSSTFAPLESRRLYRPVIISSADNWVVLEPTSVNSSADGLVFSIFQQAQNDTLGFIFSTNDLFLGCDKPGGFAKLVSDAVVWNVTFVGDGNVVLDSSMGQLQLHREDNAILSCLAPVPDNYTYSQFSINVLQQSNGASIGSWW